MRQDEKIENRIKTALSLTKALYPTKLAVALSAEVGATLSNFMDIACDPQVDVFMNKNGKYKVRIEAEATDIKRLEY